VTAAPYGKITWDAEIPGYGIDVNPKGDRRKFIYRYLGTMKKQREYIIGYSYHMTAEEARNEVKKIIGVVADGGDPFLKRKIGAIEDVPFSKIIDEYISWGETTMKATSVSQLKTAAVKIKDRFGEYPINRLTRGFVQTEYDNIRDKNTYHDRQISWACAAWNWADQREKVPNVRNPFEIQFGVRKRTRTRILSPKETKVLWNALDQLYENRSYDRMSLYAIEMLILTALRKTEAFRLKWSNIIDADGEYTTDLDKATHVKVTEHKTDQREDSLLLNLTAPIIALLKRIPRTSLAWIFVSPNSISGHIEGVDKAWDEVRRIAELSDITIHDLRRSYSSMGARLGYTPEVMGKVVGNSARVNEKHYWHLGEEQRSQVSNDVAAAIAALRT